MPKIKVTGYITVSDDEYDPEDATGLTQEAYDEYHEQFDLEELRFTKVP